MRYRSRPVEVEAWLWDGTQEAKEQIDRVLAEHPAEHQFFVNVSGTPGRFHVETRSRQKMLLMPGDYLVRLADGSLLPTEADEFAARWEPVA